MGYRRARKINGEMFRLRTPEHSVVKWQRKENDFLDYDLRARFTVNSDHAKKSADFPHLTLALMWKEVKRICDKRIKLELGSKGDGIEWAHVRKNGIHM